MQSFFYEESSYNFTYFTSTDYPSKFWTDSEQKKVEFWKWFTFQAPLEIQDTIDLQVQK